MTTTESDPVDFTVDSLTGFSFSGTATSSSTVTVLLPANLRVDAVSERNKGIRVKAEEGKLVVVYGLNAIPFSSDAFLALPCDRLQVEEYEYYGIAYNDPVSFTAHGYINAFLLVGCEDDTTVTLSNTPLPTTITLNRQETYLIENGPTDLTGTRAISNKPISFFPGHESTVIPIGSCCFDVLTEQVPPTATWGSFFLAASFGGRASGEIYRVLASFESADVTVNCNTPLTPNMYTLVNAGDYVEFRTTQDSFCSIESNNPVLIIEFSLSQNEGAGENADPFMLMLPPVEQYSNNYVFALVPTFPTNYITAYVAPEFFQPDQIFLDSSNLQGATWTPITCSGGDVCGYITTMQLAGGEHRLSHDNPCARIGLAAYGFNNLDSYGYPGGIRTDCECHFT